MQTNFMADQLVHLRCMCTVLRRACTGVPKKGEICSSWGCCRGFVITSHKYVWSMVGVLIVLGVEEGYGHLPTRVVSIASWQSWVAQAVSAQLHPHVLLPAIEVSLCESRCGGIPGTDHAMDTPKNYDHAVKSKTESVRQWCGTCMKPCACAGGNNHDTHVKC